MNIPQGYLVVPHDQPMQAVYWAAINGECVAVIPPNTGQSCIAQVESELCDANPGDAPRYDRAYVIWQPKNRSESAWKRWEKKWSRRTGQPDKD